MFTDVKTLKFVIVGHVDHGKSTLIGRLLYDTNSLPPDKIKDIEQISVELGRETEFAYFLDHLEEERQQGVTIDTTQVFFKTDKRRYVIIDAPGHVEFVKNMITGASQAEAAILIIDAGQGVQEQTKRHAYILSLLGIRQVIVAINKMDLVDNDRRAFEEVKQQAELFLADLGIKPLCCIPISAIRGDNVVRRAVSMDWYGGPTIMESLDYLEPKALLEDGSFVFPVQDVYNINGKRIIVGRVESGTIETGSQINILPAGTITRIKSIEKFGEDTGKGYAGESIGLTTIDPVFVDRGDVLCENDGDLSLIDEFCSNVIWMSKEAFDKSEKVVLRLATQEISSRLKRILKRVNSSSLDVIEEDANRLENLEVGEVVVKTKKPILVKKFHELEGLGRFVLMRGENVCAGGIIV